MPFYNAIAHTGVYDESIGWGGGDGGAETTAGHGWVKTVEEAGDAKLVRRRGWAETVEEAGDAKITGTRGWAEIVEGDGWVETVEGPVLVDETAPVGSTSKPPQDVPPTPCEPIMMYMHPGGWKYFVQHEMQNDLHFYDIRPTAEAFNDEKDSRDSETSSVSLLSRLSLTKQKMRPTIGPEAKVCVDHSRWYAHMDRMVLQVRNISDQQANQLQQKYWSFMHDFPHLELPDNAVAAARQALHCYVMEGLRSKAESQAPFTLPEAKELLEYLDYQSQESSRNPPPPTAQPPPNIPQLPSQSHMKTILVSWILLNVSKHYGNTWYGLKPSSEKASRPAIPSKPSFWFTIISVFCFLAPIDERAHIRAAQLSSDFRGDVETWPAYIENLVREWSTFNLGATVLLSASVGFLGIPGVDAVTRIVTLFSVIFTLGSIVTSVCLLWRHQGGRERPEYNISLITSEFQVNCLAIILSIPFASLGWGVILFLIAIMLYPFLGFQTFVPGNVQPLHEKPSAFGVLVLGIWQVVVIPASFLFLRSFRRRTTIEV